MAASSQMRSQLARLSAFVLDLTNSERIGGRTRVIGENSIELLDCMYWPHDATELVQHDFPEVVGDVRACRQSLSGFSVVFMWRDRGRVEALWYVAIGVGLTSCAYALLASPWWGAYRWMQQGI